MRTQILKAFERPYFFTHNWHFAFVYHSARSSVDLFSLPLNNDKYQIHLYDTHIEKTNNDTDIFKNVNELRLSLTSSIEHLKLPKSSFFNVENLHIISSFQHLEGLTPNLFVDLSNIVKLPTLKSIEFTGDNLPRTTLILLDYTKNLQSLSISLSNLVPMTKALTDQHICQQLTKLIKHLTLQ